MKKGLPLIWVLLSAFSHAQVDFDNYKSFTAQGNIPKDFTESIAAKVQKDLNSKRNHGNLKKSEVEEFYTSIHFGINNMLHSGVITYGDEISLYVKEVGDKITSANGLRADKYRYYTIKSNASNAFSTDQGIIFVTTGLISQMESEAQLAFVLAHEIAHHEKEHVKEGFEYRKGKDAQRKNLKQLATYSQEKELEADKIGIDYFQKAGYSRKDILQVFDVMMYSYLPIDEVPVDRTFFNDDLCYLPEEFFTSDVFPITVEEEFDDELSSHPNILRRRTAATAQINSLDNWGEISSYLTEDKFKYIRNICRFERVRLHLLDERFVDALYTVYILEKTFPNSLYLHRMKAQAWFSIAAYNNEGNLGAVIPSKSDWEGEIGALYYTINEMNKREMASISLRKIQDCAVKFPDDEQINKIRDKALYNFFHCDCIASSDLKNISFSQFSRAKQEAVQKTGSSNSEITEQKEELSKYDKIKKKRESNDITSDIDSTKFYLYALSDLVDNELFKSAESQYKLDKEDEEKEEGSKKKAKKSATNRSTKFIIVEPIVFKYDKKDNVEIEKSSDLTERYLKSLANSCERLKLDYVRLDRENLERLGTTGFNDRSLCASLLAQINSSEGSSVPIDYEQIRELTAKYKTNKIVFTLVETQTTLRPLWTPILTFYIPIVNMFLLPNTVDRMFTTNFTTLVIDADKGEAVIGDFKTFSDPCNQASMEAHIYDILNRLL